MVTVERTSYGTTSAGERVDLYTLANTAGVKAQVTNYGAILVAVETPDRQGNVGEITLGCRTLAEWEKDTSSLGATVGRYANRIAGAAFTLDHARYELAKNNGANHLHGGRVGFNKKVWRGETVPSADSAGVKLTYVSPDGEEGYPGTLTVTVTYTLTADSELRIDYEAATDKPTVCNLTNHTYWNLATPAEGDVLGHVLTIHADQYTPADEGLIPTGELASVEGTPLDFRTPTPVGKRIGEVGAGYDHNFVVRREGDGCVPAAVVYEPESGRVMEVFATEPGLQLYTGNHLNPKMPTRGGATYGKHAGLCLEAQKFPDTPNKPTFPSAVLRPGQTYRQRTVYKFSTR